MQQVRDTIIAVLIAGIFVLLAIWGDRCGNDDSAITIGHMLVAGCR